MTKPVIMYKETSLVAEGLSNLYPHIRIMDKILNSILHLVRLLFGAGAAAMEMGNENAFCFTVGALNFTIFLLRQSRLGLKEGLTLVACSRSLWVHTVLTCPRQNSSSQMSTLSVQRCQSTKLEPMITGPLVTGHSRRLHSPSRAEGPIHRSPGYTIYGLCPAVDLKSFIHIRLFECCNGNEAQQAPMS